MYYESTGLLLYQIFFKIQGLFWKYGNFLDTAPACAGVTILTLIDADLVRRDLQDFNLETDKHRFALFGFTAESAEV
jgi:hypothetical protein